MKTVSIGAVSLHAIAGDEVLSALDALVDDDAHHFVAFCDAHVFVRANREPGVRAILARASLLLPDGVSVTAGARLLGKRFDARVTGPETMLRYLSHGVTLDRRHFFYGGAAGVAERLAERLSHQIPGLWVVGTYTPPFRPLTQEEDDEVKALIEESRADVVWVGLGAPKQEQWMLEHLGKIKVPLMMGVGAAFDFHSGARKWAPAWMRRAGLEWVFRTATGGQRVTIRNVRYVSAFVALILQLSLAQRFGRG